MSIVKSLLHNAGAAYSGVTRINKQLQQNVHDSLHTRPRWNDKGGPSLLSASDWLAQAKETYGINAVNAARKNPSGGNIAMAAAGLPLFGGEGSAVRRALLEDAVKQGKAAGGAVKVSFREPVKAAGVHPHYMNDLVHQQGGGGLRPTNGQQGIEAVIAHAKSGKNPNIKYHEDPSLKPGTDAWNKGLDPGSMHRHAIVVEADGTLHIGQQGLHHHQVQQMAGMKSTVGSLQSELHHSRDAGDLGMLPGQFFTTNGMGASYGYASHANVDQHRSIVELLQGGNGNKWESKHVDAGHPQHQVRPNDNPQLHDPLDPANLAMRDAQQTALQVAGKHPGTGPQHKRTAMGVQPGGMGKGTGKVDAPFSIAVGSNLPKVGPGPKRLDPSTAPKEMRNPKFIPTSAAEKAQRGKLLDTRAAVQKKKNELAAKERARVAKLQPASKDERAARDYHEGRSIAPRKWKDSGTEWTGKGPKPKWLK